MGQIVEAVGIAVGGNSDNAKRLEAAMVEGLKDAMAANVSLDDVEKIREYQEKAKQRAGL